MSGVAPPDKSLLPQQFYWDTSVPPGKIWAGVPGTQDPSGKVLVLDTGNIQAGGGGGTVSPLVYKGPHNLTVGTSSAQLIAAGTYTTALTIQTLPGDPGNIWLRLDGSTAAPATGVLISGYGGSRSFGAPGFPVPASAITAVTDGGAPQTVLISGG